MGQATANTESEATSEMLGSDILVESLVRHGSDVIFAYPGGASMPIHQSLTKYRKDIRTILPRHEQGCGFGAIGYARATGKVGVCMATSGPGATNLVTSLADAKMDSIPVVAITGQVASHFIGTDAFQETPITDVCKLITKHHYLITDVDDIARVVKEAYHIASTGRPGPVLIDIPKDIQMTSTVPVWDQPMYLRGYRPQLRKAAPEAIERVAELISKAKRPMIYCGGGIISAEATEEMREFFKKTGIPAALTVMGLGAIDGNDPLCLNMLGMHGSVYANYAVNDADLLLAFGVRFDDRVTGKIDEFVKHGVIVHVDIDESELNKNKPAHLFVHSDIKYFLGELNKIVEKPKEIGPWVDRVKQWKDEHPYSFDESDQRVLPQYAIEELCRQSRGKDVNITTGVGQHQMWTAQHFLFERTRQFASSSGLGTMGYGLPTSIGVAVGRPDAISIDIDGDGSFQMNIQELATLVCEKIPVKIMILNNKHLGMVMQWEDRFHEGNRAHTYLGPVDDPEATGKGSGGIVEEFYPDFGMIAKGYGIQTRMVDKKEDLPDAIAEMLASDGPFLLDVHTPYQEHVLPMIPGGKTVKEIIKA